jgi:cytochrome P450
MHNWGYEKVSTNVDAPSADECPVKVADFLELIECVRSRSVISDVEDFTGTDELSRTGADNFSRNVVTFVNGAEHLQRRRKWNTLLRGDSVSKIRETVVMPAFERQLQRRLTQPNADGHYEIDLAQLIERVVLEMGSALIGFNDVHTEEGLDDLQECVYPMLAATTSIFFENRAEVIRAGLQAREKFVERFLKPAITAMRENLAKVEAGQMSEADLPHNLVRFFVTDPEFADFDLQIREANTMFVASVGTSVQAIVATIDDLSKWFANHPDEYDLRSDPKFLSDALQESIRLKGPYILYMTRRVVEDFSVGDREFRAGQVLQIKFPAADRSKEIFGEDAPEFNPHRPQPEGHPRYGVGFGAGEHQCFGLRMVLGNDGSNGGHVRLVQRLLEIGVKPHPEKAPLIQTLKDDDDPELDIVNYINYPAIVTSYKPEADPS